MRTPTTIALGRSTPRCRRASATGRTRTATAHFSRLRRFPSGTSEYRAMTDQPGDGEHVDRRHRPAAPAPSQGHAERPRLGGRVGQEVDGDLRQLRHDQVDHQVAPSAEDDQRHGEHPDGDLDHPPRAGVADPPGDAMDPGKVDAAHPPHDRVVDDPRRDRRARDPVAVDQHGQDHGDDGADEPAGPGPAQVPGQRRRGARRASPRRSPPRTARWATIDDRRRCGDRRLPEIRRDVFAHWCTIAMWRTVTHRTCRCTSEPSAP